MSPMKSRDVKQHVLSFCAVFQLFLLHHPQLDHTIIHGILIYRYPNPTDKQTYQFYILTQATIHGATLKGSAKPGLKQLHILSLPWQQMQFLCPLHTWPCCVLTQHSPSPSCKPEIISLLGASCSAYSSSSSDCVASFSRGVFFSPCFPFTQNLILARWDLEIICGKNCLNWENVLQAKTTYSVPDLHILLAGAKSAQLLTGKSGYLSPGNAGNSKFHVCSWVVWDGMPDIWLQDFVVTWTLLPLLNGSVRGHIWRDVTSNSFWFWLVETKPPSWGLVQFSSVKEIKKGSGWTCSPAPATFHTSHPGPGSSARLPASRSPPETWFYGVLFGLLQRWTAALSVTIQGWIIQKWDSSWNSRTP